VAKCLSEITNLANFCDQQNLRKGMNILGFTEQPLNADITSTKGCVITHTNIAVFAT
jgi:hypothetical protein